MTMKKLMIVASAALCGTVGFGEIVSANTVGYNTVDLVAGPNLLSLSWENVGTGSGVASLNDVMDTSKLSSCDEEANGGDEINTWNVAAGDWGAVYRYANLPDIDPSYADTWINGDGMPVNPVVPTGSAFWLFAEKPVEGFCIKGQVANTESSVITLVKGPNLIANPLPSDLNLNDKNQVVCANLVSCDEEANGGDEINTWNANTGDWGAVYRYANLPDIDAAYADTWIDGEGMPVATTAIPAGTGFWFFASGDGTTLTFK